MSNKITHSGILGMKWGVRKVSEDHTESRQLKKKSVKELSNKEITKITTRLQLEKSLDSLSPTEVSRGKKIVGQLISKFGPMIVSAFVAHYAKKKYDNWAANPTGLPLLEGVIK